MIRFFVNALLCLILLLIATSLFGQTTYVWIGISSNWTTPTNWNPTRNNPAINDILVFNSGNSITVTNVPTQTIGKLIVENPNTNVVLQPSASGNVLSINGGQNALLVSANCQLNCNTSNALFITVKSGSTGVIFGSMVFNNGGHRLQAEDSYGISFESGSMFSATTNFSGNAFGTTYLNSVVFKSGSIYVSGAGANPFGASAPNSCVVFQSGSLYRHTQTALPSLSGRTYANFELNNSSFNQTSTGTGLLVIDNLTITNCNIMNLNLTGGIHIKGNITVSAGTLNFNPASSNTLILNGTTQQTIGGNGNINFNGNTTFVLNNPIGLLLQKAITIPGTLILQSGVINNSMNNMTLQSKIVRINGAFTTSPNISSSIDIEYGESPLSIATGWEIPANQMFLNQLTVNRSGGVVLNSNISVNGTLSLTNGALNIGAYTLTINGAITQTNGSLTGGTSSNLIIGGSGASTTLPAVILNNLTLNRVNGISLGGNVTVHSSLNLANGDLNIGANTLTINGAITQTNGSLTGGTSSNLVIGGSTASTTLPALVLNNLTLNRANGIYLGGMVTVNGTCTLLTGVLNNSSNALTINGTIVRIDGSLSNRIVYTNPLNVVYEESTIPITTGYELYPPLSKAETTVNNLTINRSGGVTLQDNNNLYVTGTLYLTSGSFSVGANTLVLHNPIVKTGGLLQGGSNTNVNVTTNGDVVLPSELGNLIINGNVNLINDIMINDINFTSGYLDLNGYSMTVAGKNLSVTSTLTGDRIFSFFDVLSNPAPGSIGRRNTITKAWQILTQSNGPLQFTVNWNTPADDNGIIFTNGKGRVFRYSGGIWNDLGEVTITELGDGKRSATFSIDFSGKAENGEITIAGDEAPVLPVELSSFTAIATAQNYVMINWTTQTETNVSCYYIYRNRIQDLGTAERINAIIPATNTSYETNYSFIDREVTIGTWYYWLQNVNMSGEYDFHGPVSVNLEDDSENNLPIIPQLTSLKNIYPNPFNPSVTISYGLATNLPVKLEIFNIKGDKIRTLVDCYKIAGTHYIQWNGKNDNGKDVASGVYYLKMSAGKYNTLQKLVLMK